jgi:sulfate transport system substrate-binding protein
MLIQNPAAVTEGSVSQNPGLARKFLAFMYTPQAQRIWAQNYYWPVVASVAKKYKFPKPKKLFTIRQFGGWTHADPQFFGTNGLWMKIENGG